MVGSARAKVDAAANRDITQLEIGDEGTVGGGGGSGDVCGGGGGGVVGISIGKGGRGGDCCVGNGRSVVASTSGTQCDAGCDKMFHAPTQATRALPPANTDAEERSPASVGKAMVTVTAEATRARGWTAEQHVAAMRQAAPKGTKGSEDALLEPSKKQRHSGGDGAYAVIGGRSSAREPTNQGGISCAPKGAVAVNGGPKCAAEGCSSDGQTMRCNDGADGGSEGKCRGDGGASFGSEGKCRGDKGASIGSEGRCRGDGGAQTGRNTACRGEADG